MRAAGKVGLTVQVKSGWRMGYHDWKNPKIEGGNFPPPEAMNWSQPTLTGSCPYFFHRTVGDAYSRLTIRILVAAWKGSMGSSTRLEGQTWTGSLRSGSVGLFERNESVFSLASSTRTHHDEEEALKWAAIEKLPTYDRLRTSILKNIHERGDVLHDQIDVRSIELETRQQLMERLVKVADQDNERFLNKLRRRIDRVGITLPEIEIRYEHLNIEADVYVGGRALPTLINYTANIVEELLGSLHLYKSNKKTLNILHDVSGVIKPGRMTLLLGPPASGKTTLLLALAGKLDRSLQVTGGVKYNGHGMEEFVPQRTSAYISQYDLHIGEMTVRETLDFSARCQGVGSRYDVLTELSRREKDQGIKPDPDIDIFMKATAIEGQRGNIITDYILKILGLDVCADTMVGDAMRRGISGGQKKRVTTGEMIVGPAKALFMDEISTGLDSSTTYQIVRCLRQFVHVFNATMVISLLQPAPETFDLFDDVILLSEGQLVYQGPREAILEFFESMGFKCPERKGVADFLQEVTSRKDQEQYWADRRQPYRYVPVKEFADAFQSFHVGARLNAELSIPFDKSKSHPAALTKEKYGLSKMELFKACFDREVLLMKRSSFVYIFKFTQISIVALIAMTVFFRTKMHDRNLTDGSIYAGALFFGLVMVMFNGMAELSMTIEKLPVFYKQRDILLYPAWAYSLPTWVMRIPLSLMDSVVWVVLTYYTIGFAPNPNRFFRHWLLMFVLHQMSLGLFRFIAALGRNMIVANTFGSFALLVIFVLGGFIVSREDIKSWWKWGYWSSPLMYAQNGISVNEFLATRWQKPNDNVGVRLLEGRGIFPHSYWYWLAVGALLGYNVLFNFLYTLALHYLNPLGSHQALISEDEIDEKQSNRTGESTRRQVSKREMQTTSSARVSFSQGPRNEIQASGAASQRRRSGNSSRSDSIIESAREAGKKGMVLPFQPLALAFDNVNYYVDMPAEMKQQGVTEDRLQLLRGVSGSFRPGVLTALVGVSGAGKTTLMDVLAGRKTGGYIEGPITISGYPKNQETFARISGYCEQNDIHSPYVTLYEALVYSAWLRLPAEVDPQARKMFVDEVMDLVELNNLRDALVGLPGVNGLSTEQRKRLTIAVELVANPSIIFMDEPTSGLDARAAAIVMRTVRNTVDTGRTVVCTIHQPSIDIFEAFDELVLMKRGGQMIYVGPLGRHSQTLVDYFEAIEGVPKITPGYNPATWMLEVSSVGQELRLGVDFAELYRNSSLYQRNQALIKELSQPAPGSKDLYFESQYAQPFPIQTLACLWKQHWSYWRNPQYNAVRFFFTFICSLLFGTIFWRMGHKTGRQQDVLNAMGSMFSAVLFLGVNNASSVQPVVDVERTVFYREKAAGMYSALPYALAQVLIELPYVFVQSVMYGLVVYAMIDFKWTAVKFFWFFFFMFFTFLYFTYYGMMTVALTPNTSIAAIVSSAFYGIWMLFCGFLIPRPKIPVWWRWYYWACPVAWTLYGLIASQYGDITTMMDLTEAVVTVGFAVLFAFIFAVSIRTLNFQTR
eukprot:Gb_37006 [translate_table: standard]